MGVEELSSVATASETDAFIEATIAELHGETPPDTKNTSSSVESSAGDVETAGGKTAGEGQRTETKATDQSEDWRDDEVKELATAYGIDDKALASFSSRDELERALSLFDNHAMQAGSNAGDQQAGEQGTAREAQNVERHPVYPDRRPDGTLLPADQRQSQQAAKPSEFTLNLDPEVVGEDVVNTFKGLQTFYESKFQALEQRLAEQQKLEQSRQMEAYYSAFDAVVDSLGETELFGETGKETKEQMANRRLLESEFAGYANNLSRQGRSVSLSKPFVGRAMKRAFADHLIQRERQQLTQRLQQQSSQRLGIGSQNHKDVEFQGTIDEEGRIAPDLQAEFDRLVKGG